VSDGKVSYNITKDDLSAFAGKGPAFVTFGETMVRDTPCDMQRLEMTRQVDLSLAGSDSRWQCYWRVFGIQSAYITRVPDNPYGWLLRDTARSQGINTDYIVWGSQSGTHWQVSLRIRPYPTQECRLLPADVFRSQPLGWQGWWIGSRLCATVIVPHFWHHLRAGQSQQVRAQLPAGRVLRGDGSQARRLYGWSGYFNYRATLWSPEQCRSVMTPLVTEYIDV